MGECKELQLESYQAKNDLKHNETVQNEVAYTAKKRGFYHGNQVHRGSRTCRKE